MMDSATQLLHWTHCETTSTSNCHLY